MGFNTTGMYGNINDPTTRQAQGLPPGLPSTTAPIEAPPNIQTQLANQQNPNARDTGIASRIDASSITGGPASPTSGNTTNGAPQINWGDGASVDAFISYMGNVAGVNPSVKNDPGYWRDKILSGELGHDQNYIISKMMTPEGAPAGSGGGGGGGSSASAWLSGNYTAPTSLPNAGALPMQGQSDQLFQMLMDRAKQGLDVNPNDPIIKGQTEAYDASQQRAVSNYLRAAAEKQGPSANITAETRAANEKAGEATSGFQASLMQHELDQRRTEIQNALTQMGAFLTDEQRMTLQGQLALLDQQLGYARLNEQSNEFGASLGQRAYEYDTSRWDSLFS